MLNETVPEEKSATFSVTINLGVITGIMVCLLLGLPIAALEFDPIKAASTNLWMITYASPIVVSTINLLMMCTCFREEPLQFLLSKGRKEEAIRLISKVYRTENASQKYEELIGKQDTEEKPASKVGYYDALSGSKYWRVTWFAIVMAFFNQFCGCNAVTIYSTQIFKSLKISSTVGSIITGVS